MNRKNLRILNEAYLELELVGDKQKRGVSAIPIGRV